ncbi:MAG: acyl-CoA dehydrogenase [Ilumatobacteraceae bacterium]|nr:acyl-CoA dehydrogenase [Ilumatobacteraceae bacterium]
MELLPGEDDARRIAIKKWLADNARPSAEQLADAGLVAPHWPVPYGLGADPVHQLIIDEELHLAGVSRPSNPIGIGWAGPTILFAGSDYLKERYLRPMLSGAEFWCQLFSEPGSGSDLASLGTRAVRDGDEWIINGQKIWTSGAQYSQFGILIARTDPDVSKYKGVTYFICPMDAAGIEIRPIKSMAGAESFNEVFFTDVRIPQINVVGDVNDGWRLAKVTLGNERVSLSTGGVLWGGGPTALELIESAKKLGPITDPVMRQRIAALYTEHTVLEIIRMRTLTARLRGEQPGPESSVRKIIADEHGQHAMQLARDLIGAHAMLTGDDKTEDFSRSKTLYSRAWYSGYMFSQALTIGGGTGEVQRNILGERVLGLPSEPNTQQGMSWSESRRASGAT